MRSRTPIPAPFIAAGILNIAVAALALGGCLAIGSDKAAAPTPATLSPTTALSSPTEPSPESPSSAFAPNPENSAAADRLSPEEGPSQEKPAAEQALSTLETIPVKGRAPKTGYEREQFGQAWSDDVGVEYGHNGCDTRNDILRRDISDALIKEGTHGCVVLSGTLHDPYSGQDIAFQRGRDTSSAVQIDHVVPLADAWQKGAQLLTPEQRRDFANDPRNLLAVDGGLNQQKSAGDAATWLPPNKGFRCEYAQRIVEVRAAYGLWTTEAEHAALDRLLRACQ